MGTDFIKLFISNLCLYLGLTMANGILGVFSQSLGAPSYMVGFITGCFAMAALLLKIISGPALDAFDRKKIMAGAMIGMGMSYLGYAISSTPLILVIFSFLRGACQAFSATASLVIAADILREDKVTEGIGILSLAYVVCQCIGSSLALFLSVYVGYRLTFVLCVASELIGALVVLSIKQHSHGTKRFVITTDSIITKKAVVPSIIIGLLNGVVLTAIAFVPITAMSVSIPQETSGLFFTIYAVTLVVLRPFIARISEKIGFKIPFAITLTVFAIAFIVLGNITSLTTLLISGFLAGVGYSAGHPLMQSIAMKRVSADQRSAASVTCFIGNDLGSFLLPIVGGIIANDFGYTLMWYAMLVPIFFALLLILFLHNESAQQ